ncbi:MAG: hypothetical protein VB137_15875 [Burkholderia sp.]
MSADPAEAARYARQELPVAQFMLANAYRAGASVPRDEARAGALYRSGELGVKRDEDAYHAQWLEAAHALT